MMKKSKILLSALIMGTFVTPAFAGDGAVEVIGRLVTTLSSATSLLSMAMILFGMYSIYQLIMTFISRDENNRDFPMKNAPFYFIGAALGLGSMMMSGVVQQTLFESENTAGTKDIWTTTTK